MTIEQSVICVDCSKEIVKPYDNGDGQIRCETCAVEKYKKGAVMLWQQIPVNPKKESLEES